MIGGHERKKPGLCAPPALSFFGGGGHMSGMAFAAVAPTHVAEVENKIAAHDAAMPAAAIDLASLDVLASNLQAVWSAPTTDARLKTRIVRTLIHEVVADTTTRPPRSSSLFTGWAAPTAKCTYPSVGADSATVCLIFAPLKGYDEPEILHSSLTRRCLVDADAGHFTRIVQTSFGLSGHF